MENLDKILNEEDINAVSLEELLKARKNKKIDFVLIDIRETFESEDSRIPDTDFFYPTSDFNNNQSKYQDFKDKRVILYCRSSSRTGQVKSILKSTGIDNVSHLRGGMMSYMGNTQSGSI